MYLSVDGPVVYKGLSVTNTAVLAQVGVSPLDERKIVQLQAIDGEVYYGYDNTVTAGDAGSGFKIFRGQTIFLELGPLVQVYLIAEIGNTVNVKIAELS